MRLHDLTKEVFETADKYADSRYSAGVDMFLKEIENAGKPNIQYHYAVDGVDYEALKPHLAELKESKNEFLKAILKNYDELTKLRKEGKHDEVVELVVAYAE